ncbi:MAG: LLM class flavin-dependent oxidoreductase [Proteobacteria bacterium]|nr:LLM class flavin-dependent oxidoreductase [Pseudomonadota bacterium]
MPRTINFGLWYDFRNPNASLTFEDFYAASLDQIAWAEDLGFNSVWLTEHHFVEDGYTPSPLVIAAAIAQKTRQMRIGTNLMLLPVADPIRLAEDAATLSILSGGRFDLGVGLGYRQVEFDYFKRQLKNRPSLMEEGVEIIRQAWSGQPVNFNGRRFQIDNLRVTPQPTEPPRLLMGGMATPAIARAARIGDGFLSTGGIGHDDYLAALDALDKPRSEGAIFAGQWGVISADPEREAARMGQYALYQTNHYIKWGAFGPPESTPEFATAADALRDGMYEMHDADSAVTALTALLTQYPQIKDIHFWAQFPGEPFDQGNARMEYIARNVIPRVRRNIENQATI